MADMKTLSINGGAPFAIHDEGALRKAGDAMTGDLNMANHRVLNVPEPATDSEPATRKYVNDHFAPTGYGLGEAVMITDGRSVDAIRQTGWFAWDIDGVTDAPFAAGYMLVTAGRVENNVTQMIFDANYSDIGKNRMQVRTYGLTGWSEWEWVNPPMEPGVEYATTEHYNGKTVYTKLINFGNLPASGRAYVNALGFSANVFEITGVASWGDGYEYPFPMFNESTGAFICGVFIYNGSTTSVGVYALQDLSGATAKFKMKYTKN